MKKLFLTALFAMGMAASASAAPIAVNLSINGFVLASTVNDATPLEIDFSTFQVATCSNAIFCGNPGDGVAASPNPFESGQVFTFTWGGGTLIYTTSTAWPAPGAGPNFAINTTGVYSSNVAGFDPTPGVLNLSFNQPVDDQGFYALAANGASAPVPEPASMALLGAGLLGIGVLARRRKA